MDASNRLGHEIKKRLGERSQTWLAEQAGTTQATISRIIRGVHIPAPDTIVAIAKVLEVDPTYLMRLAGIPLPGLPTGRDPSVEYIAKKLDALPPSIREDAIEALGVQLDTIYKVAGLTPLEPKRPPSNEEDPEFQAMIEELVHLVRQMRDKQPDALPHIFELLSQQLPPQGPGDNPEPPSGQQRKAS